MSEFHNLPYRRCAGMMILNAQGLVWIGRRKKKKTQESELCEESFLWQMPQGGIDEGESPLKAAEREAYEETGIKSLKLLDEAPFWVYYDLPDDSLGLCWQGKYRGQMQKWFAFHFYGHENEIRVVSPPSGHPSEFDAWAWCPMKKVPELVVPFKRDVYLKVVNTFSYLERSFKKSDSAQ